MPASLPYVVDGTITNSNGIAEGLAILNWKNTTSDSTEHNMLSNADGSYNFDLGNLGYSDGDSVRLIVTDRFNNETKTETLLPTGAGGGETRNVTLALRTVNIQPDGNRANYMVNIGGKPISKDNPLPVYRSHDIRRKTGTISVSSGTGSVAVSNLNMRCTYFGVKLSGTFTVNVTDTDTGINLITTTATSTSGGNATSKGLEVPMKNITITITNATADGTYSYLIMG